MIRLAAGLFFACVSIAAALVASADYRFPTTVSLACYGACIWTWYPLWATRRYRILLALVAAPLTILSASTFDRLVSAFTCTR